MGTLNVQVPDGMEGEIDEHLRNNPYCVNRSELVRDSLRHTIAAGKGRKSDEIDRIAAKRLYESASESARRKIAERQVDESEIDEAIEWARARTDESE